MQHIEAESVAVFARYLRSEGGSPKDYSSRLELRRTPPAAHRSPLASKAGSLELAWTAPLDLPGAGPHPIVHSRSFLAGGVLWQLSAGPVVRTQAQAPAGAPGSDGDGGAAAVEPSSLQLLLTASLAAAHWRAGEAVVVRGRVELQGGGEQAFEAVLGSGSPSVSITRDLEGTTTLRGGGLAVRLHLYDTAATWLHDSSHVEARYERVSRQHARTAATAAALGVGPLLQQAVAAEVAAAADGGGGLQMTYSYNGVSTTDTMRLLSALVMDNLLCHFDGNGREAIGKLPHVLMLLRTRPAPAGGDGPNLGAGGARLAPLLQPCTKPRPGMGGTLLPPPLPRPSPGQPPPTPATAAVRARPSPLPPSAAPLASQGQQGPARRAARRRRVESRAAVENPGANSAAEGGSGSRASLGAADAAAAVPPSGCSGAVAPAPAPDRRNGTSAAQHVCACAAVLLAVAGGLLRGGLCRGSGQPGARRPRGAAGRPQELAGRQLHPPAGARAVQAPPTPAHPAAAASPGRRADEASAAPRAPQPPGGSPASPQPRARPVAASTPAPAAAQPSPASPPRAWSTHSSPGPASPSAASPAAAPPAPAAAATAGPPRAVEARPRELAARPAQSSRRRRQGRRAAAAVDEAEELPVRRILSLDAQQPGADQTERSARGEAAAWGRAAAAAAAAAAKRAGGCGGGGEEAACCLVCLDAPRELGFLHGGTMHVGVCGDCAARLAAAAKGSGARLCCPVCREDVERTVAVFQ